MRRVRRCGKRCNGPGKSRRRCQLTSGITHPRRHSNALRPIERTAPTNPDDGLQQLSVRPPSIAAECSEVAGPCAGKQMVNFALNGTIKPGRTAAAFGVLVCIVSAALTADETPPRLRSGIEVVALTVTV